MAWRQAFRNILGSPTIVSMTIGVLATGTYVLYNDRKRLNRMHRAYGRGVILAPLAENNFEVTYFKRPQHEQKLRKILSSDFTNEYYLIYGETGSGKTRTIVEIVREMIGEKESEHKGAPIYVLSVQGTSFPDSLARTVRFYYDEHVKFAFFMDVLMGIHSFPSRDDNNRLVRVLGAIEKSAFQYMTKSGRPVVLILDGIDSLNSYMPGALEKLQDKAKLWADANIVKVIFVCNDEDTVSLLQKNSSNWSRAATPIVIDDMTRQDAIEFLRTPKFMEYSKETKIMPVEEAEKIVDLVGGHIQHLIICKRNWLSGISHEDTVSDLMMREREKFVNVSRKPALWVAVSKLRKAKKKRMLLSKLIKETNEATVQSLVRENVIRYRRNKLGTTVQFQSRLTENVIEELQRVYDKKTLAMMRATKVQQQNEEVPNEQIKTIQEAM